jgi:hypothetical protein
MSRPRDRASAAGLLPLMEARPWRDGKTVTYRYHPAGGKPVNLGTDRTEALRRVLEMNGQADDTGTIRRLWEQYKRSPSWQALKERTRSDYENYSGPLLNVFGDVHAASVSAPDIAPSRIANYHGEGLRALWGVSTKSALAAFISHCGKFRGKRGLQRQPASPLSA